MIKVKRIKKKTKKVKNMTEDEDDDKVGINQEYEEDED